MWPHFNWSCKCFFTLNLYFDCFFELFQYFSVKAQRHSASLQKCESCASVWGPGGLGLLQTFFLFFFFYVTFHGEGWQHSVHYVRVSALHLKSTYCCGLIRLFLFQPCWLWPSHPHSNEICGHCAHRSRAQMWKEKGKTWFVCLLVLTMLLLCASR